MDFQSSHTCFVRRCKMSATRLKCQDKTKPPHDQRIEQRSDVLQLSRVILGLCVIIIVLAVPAEAQYKADDIPGFLGLSNGTQPPPGLYLGSLAWVYPTDTVKDNNGNSVTLPGSLTSTAEIILVNLVTNYKLFGGNIGASGGFPFIKNRIQTDSLDVSTGFAYTDMFVGVNIGWSFKRADVMAGYNLYIPTGTFMLGGNDNTGLGMWGNEFTIGSTVYLDQKKLWNAAGTFAFEFNTDKSGTNIQVGDVGTVSWGLGRTFYKRVSGPVPLIMNVGAVGYAQFKITGDSGSDIPPPLMGFKDRIFAAGPEFNIYIPKPRLTFLGRYEPEFGGRVRTQGQSVVISVAWVAKYFEKKKP
jgi:hypothetical protein